jgi:RND superfamily putative drug exporter
VRQVSEALDSQFPVNSTAPVEALVTGARAPAQLTAYLHRIDAIPGVTGAQVTGRNGDTARIDIGYQPAPVSSAARHIVTQIRGLPAPPAPPCWSAGPPRGWWTSWPASAPPCPGWRC